MNLTKAFANNILLRYIAIVNRLLCLILIAVSLNSSPSWNQGRGNIILEGNYHTLGISALRSGG